MNLRIQSVTGKDTSLKIIKKTAETTSNQSLGPIASLALRAQKI